MTTTPRLLMRLEGGYKTHWDLVPEILGLFVDQTGLAQAQPNCALHTEILVRTDETTLAFGSHDMHVKVLVIMSLLFSASGVAQNSPSAPSSEPKVPEDSEKPELTRRSLPTDTFKPSEKVSEDFPVPFPVDI